MRAEHRLLDVELAALIEAGSADQLEVARMKKRKLRLKDAIAQLADEIIPDIIA